MRMLLSLQFHWHMVSTAYGLMPLFHFQSLWEPFEMGWNTWYIWVYGVLKGYSKRWPWQQTEFFITLSYSPLYCLHSGLALDIHNNTFKVKDGLVNVDN